MHQGSFLKFNVLYPVPGLHAVPISIVIVQMQHFNQASFQRLRRQFGSRNPMKSRALVHDDSVFRVLAFLDQPQAAILGYNGVGGRDEVYYRCLDIRRVVPLQPLVVFVVATVGDHDFDRPV